MQIDDLLIRAGRRYVVVGFSDMSVVPQFVYLEDVEAGKVIRVARGELGPERRKRDRPHPEGPGSAAKNNP